MFSNNGNGWLEIISGGMFSGKSTELIRRLRILQQASKRFVLFKPRLDNRYSQGEVATHDGQRMQAVVVDCANDILEYLNNHPEIEVIGIDEGQFFDEKLVKVVIELVQKRGKRVIIATLLEDYAGNPFGPVNQVLYTADQHDVLYAVCSFCKKRWASHSPRISSEQRQIKVGASEYRAACHRCFQKILNGAE